MTRIFFDGRDIEVAIRHGGLEHAFPLVALAAVLRMETSELRSRVERLLRARERLSTDSAGTVPSRAEFQCGMLDGEPTEGTVPIRSDAVREEISPNRSDTDRNETVTGDDVRDLTPEALARQLGDVPNVAALAVLVRDLPASLILDALHQALAIPATRLRTNRAALFTAIVRRLVRARTNPTSYARTSSSST